MATTFTQNLTLPNPTPADPSVTDAWGTLENTGRTLIDTAITGILSLSIAGNTTPVILTSNTGAPDQSRNRAFIFTGLLTGNILVLWPQGLNRFFSVTNSTTGAFTVTLAVNNGAGAAAGSTFVIAQNATLSFQSDGTNITASPNAPGGPAGGDLGGTYPNPTVTATHLSAPLPAAQGGTGQSSTGSVAVTGDVTGTLGASTVAKVNGFSVATPSATQPWGIYTGQQTFSPGGSYTFNVPAGITRLLVEVVGAGGGGAGSVNGGFPSGGGAGGGYGRKLLTGLTPGATLTITVGTAGTAGALGGGAGGTGGTSSVSGTGFTTITVTGGSGGTAGTAGSLGSGGATPGTCTGGGDLILTGQAGQDGQNGGANNVVALGGDGGFSPLGYGQPGRCFGAGSSGTGFGGGGGGAQGGTAAAGGAGAPGGVVITW